MKQNRWFQLVASLIAMVMIANLQYAWTLFVNPLRQANGWSLAEVQWAFTLFILFQTWVQPLDGWLIDRLGPRLFISVAGVLCGLGWAGMGYATSLPMLYALYCAGGHRRRARLQRLHRVGAEVVPGQARLRSGRHRRRLRRRHGAVHPVHRLRHSHERLSDRVSLDRRPPGARHLHRRAVPPSPAARAGRGAGRQGQARRGRSISSRPPRCCARRTSTRCTRCS